MTLPDLITRHQEAVETILKTTVEGRKDPLYRMMEYQMGWVDGTGSSVSPSIKRAYAALALGACEALGGDVKSAIPAGVALELLFQFTRIHDDIQEGTPDHGPQPSVWWVWGPAQAINAGDALHVLARLSLFSMAKHGISTEQVLAATKALDVASLDLFEGQHQDLLIQGQVAVSQSAYLEMAERRTGSLMGCAAQLGALIAGADETVQEQCREAGRKLGLALHLQADINELWNATPNDAPLTIVRKTFPIIHAIETTSVAVKREIGTLFTTRVMDPQDMPRLAELLESAGSHTHSVEAVGSAKAAYLSSLEIAGVPSSSLDEFTDFASHLIQYGMTGA